MSDEYTREELIEEVRDLQTEVKMLRAIVQSLLYVIVEGVEDEDLDDLTAEDQDVDFSQGCNHRMKHYCSDTYQPQKSYPARF